jgi:hypothetical protein
MIKSKDWTGFMSPCMATGLVLALSLVEAGCTGMSGFRSVGTERPSFRPFWDRTGQASPTPENDAYVLSMRGGQGRAEALASSADQDKPATDPKANAAGAGTKVAATSDPAGSGKRASAGKRGVADDTTIRVSLGRPEPLPGLVTRPSSGTRVASKGASSSWKADKNDSDASHAIDAGPALDVAGAGMPMHADAATPPREADGSEGGPADWKAILARAEDRLDALRSYQMRVSRIERVNGRLQPEEDILLSIRRDPKAVRLEWSSGPSKGREVIFASNIDPRTLFVHMPSSTIPLPVMKIAVDSPMVMRNSRHSITEAGLDTIVENLRKAESGDKNGRSASGILSYKGTKKPAGLDRLCHHFVRQTASGETWNVYLDEQSLLPFVVFAEDARGQMIERYVYREIKENPGELTTAAAFDPNQRWGEPKGLLGRFARAAAGTDLPGAAGATTR